ncbi:hypothetical protein RSPO_c00284 [Ralstonia solanacearum Po82]|uniref:Uncharacterized protein n=1 Tax=Ralstonia solanacearum (strain Po82) TaxID=1031711 RepID=F6G6P3_RALS8|nr:hypothetical protein RSPO_c00284 [Ralstonia solanacearum Po82]
MLARCKICSLSWFLFLNREVRNTYFSKNLKNPRNGENRFSDQ